MTKLRDLISSRRTIQDYSAEPLPEGALERALEAALTAPNHRMTEPWRFVRTGPEARQRVFEISLDLKNSGSAAPLTPGAVDKLKAKLLTPAELLVVSQVLAAKPEVVQEDYAAIACALQNLMLCLWEDGIGSKWSTGAVTTDARTYQCLAIDAAQERIVAFLWVGKAARGDTPKPKRRLGLAQVLRNVP